MSAEFFSRDILGRNCFSQSAAWLRDLPQSIFLEKKKKILSHELAKVEAGRQITGVVQVIDDCGEKSRDGEK